MNCINHSHPFRCWLIVGSILATLFLGLASSNSEYQKDSAHHRPPSPPARVSVSSAADPLPAANGAARHASPASPLAENLVRLPLSFERNDGQADAEVKFLAHGRGYNIFLTAGEARLTLDQPPAVSPEVRGHALSTANGLFAGTGSLLSPGGNRDPAPWNLDLGLPFADELFDPYIQTGLTPSENFPAPSSQLPAPQVVHLRLLGANQNVRVEGGGELPGKSNYYLGNDPTKWRVGIPNYARVEYQPIYPGIELVYYGNQSGQLEYDFIVAPGADPSVIAFGVTEGLSRHPSNQIGGVKPPLQIASNGDLVISTESGDLRFHKPLVYQLVSSGGQLTAEQGQRTLVDGQYVLQAGNEIGFKVASYDHTRPLIIDPVLVYSTYTVATGQGAAGMGIGIDSSGNAYILGGIGDIAITQAVILALNPQGNQFLYTTYFGPTGTGGPHAIAVDPQGDVYITGSGGAGLPTTPGAYSAACPSICNTPFAAQFSPSGTLTYATFLGPSNAASSAIAIDSSGDAYITGMIASNDLPLVNAFQPPLGGTVCSGCINAFVQKLNPSGSQLLYSTYLGGSFTTGSYGDSSGNGIAVDSSGSAYVVGVTTAPLFPVQDALEPSVLGPDGDGFLTKFTPDGSGVVYSTILGGSGGAGASGDTAVAVAVDSAGDAYVTGSTSSPDFPITMNAFKASCVEPATEACANPQFYVLEVDPNGASLLYSTLIGAGNPTSLALDSSGNAWVTGSTASNYFPVLQAIESSLQQNIYPATNYDAFVTQVNPSGMPASSTYFGGSFTGTVGAGVVVDNSGNAYVTGSTGVGNNTPVDFPLLNPTAGTQMVAQFAFPGAIFAAKISPGAGPALSLSPWYTPVLELRDVSTSPLTLNSISISSTLTIPGGTCGSSLAAGAGCMLIVNLENPAIPASGTLTISSNAPGSPQTFNLHYSSIGGPQFFVSPNYVEFPVQLVGTTSAARTVTITNLEYPDPVEITNIETSTAVPSAGISGDFSQTNNCPAVLPAGASCAVTVHFQPTAGPDGLESGQLQIMTNTGLLQYRVYLEGLRSSQSLTSYFLQCCEIAPSIQFGIQFVGATPLPRVLALTNADVQQVTLSGFTVTGPFTQTNNCSGPLASHASCRVAISFVPTGNISNATGTLAVNFSGQGSPLTVKLAGTGEILAALGVSPLQLAFGNVILGTSLTLPLTLTNSSSGTLSLSAFNLSSNYTQTNDCNGSLGPGATCTVNVTLTPSALGDQSGSLSIDFSGNGSPQVISLSGTAITALEISPQQLTFGQQDVGVASSPQTVSMGNAGAVPLTVSSVSISGGIQLLDNSCPTTLAASFYCTMEVEFTPTAVGSRSGTLTVIASDFEGTHVVLLSGTGVVVPIVGLSPTSLTFAGQLVGVASGAQAVTLSNTGSAALSLTSIAASGDFTETNNCGTSLAVNATCSIGVTFTPMAGGTRSGSITLTDNAADSPQMATLTGAGEDFAIAMASGSSTTSTVTPGQTATYNLSLAPAGGLTGSVSFTCSGAPSEATCAVSPSPATLSALSATPITVTVTTTAASGVGGRPQPPARPWRGLWIITLLTALGVGMMGVKRLAWRRALVA